MFFSLGGTDGGFSGFPMLRGRKGSLSTVPDKRHIVRNVFVLQTAFAVVTLVISAGRQTKNSRILTIDRPEEKLFRDSPAMPVTARDRTTGVGGKPRVPHGATSVQIPAMSRMAGSRNSHPRVTIYTPWACFFNAFVVSPAITTHSCTRSED